ncbi:UNVERIFIED_CONTAM: AraC family transcriptional regulator, partial [Salmonella enterica subsp. enterica serovar Weltevreden]
HYTKRDISEIAYELGFENVQVFSRFFKRLSGISPTEFRLK